MSFVATSQPTPTQPTLDEMKTEWDLMTNQPWEKMSEDDDPPCEQFDIPFVAYDAEIDVDDITLGPAIRDVAYNASQRTFRNVLFGGQPSFLYNAYPTQVTFTDNADANQYQITNVQRRMTPETMRLEHEMEYVEFDLMVR